MSPSASGDHCLEVNAEDTDGDGLPDVDEELLGTDPDHWDTDRDGLPDVWEVFGDGTVDFPALGCDPLRKDVLVELDYQEYERDGVVYSAAFSDAVVEALEAAFDEMPIETPLPDGSSSWGIALHIVHDSQLDEDFRCYLGSGTKGHHSPANPDYALTFHKATVCIAEAGSSRGNSPIKGRNMKIRVPPVDDDSTNDWDEQAQFERYRLFLHEIGHSFGLKHGGKVDANDKPNYPSLMNYTYHKRFAGSERTLAGTGIHFSEGLMPDLDEKAWLSGGMVVNRSTQLHYDFEGMHLSAFQGKHAAWK